MAKEKQFERRIKAFLDQKGSFYVKYWGGGPYTMAGIPDLLVCCNSLFMGVEVKAEDGRPEPLQLKKLRDIEKAGGFAILLYPEDFDLFKTMVNHLCNGHHEQAFTCYTLLKRRRRLWEWKLKSTSSES